MHGRFTPTTHKQRTSGNRWTEFVFLCVCIQVCISCPYECVCVCVYIIIRVPVYVSGWASACTHECIRVCVTSGSLVELRARAQRSARSPVGQPCLLYCCAAALSCSPTTGDAHKPTCAALAPHASRTPPHTGVWTHRLTLLPCTPARQIGRASCRERV